MLCPHAMNRHVFTTDCGAPRTPRPGDAVSGGEHCGDLSLGFVVTLLLGLALAAPGCSASSQEEYRRIRAIVVTPVPSESATLTAIDPSAYRGLNSGGSVIALGLAPGTASDQAIASE